MGERKVLNKYIPADFDPRLVPRSKRPKDDLVPVRMMLPFSIQCATCSSFLYRGRKFNSKKEPVRGDKGKYLGIQRFRFYIKCSVCSRPITFLTDPENTDYEMETGGTRTYEVHKDKEKTEENFETKKAEEEGADAMKALENRVLASQREVADLDNLDEIKAMNLMHLRMMAGKGGSRGKGSGATKMAAGRGVFDGSAKAVLDAREAGTKGGSEEELNENGLTAEEEAMVKNINFGKKSAGKSADGSATAPAAIRRLDDEDERKEEERRRKEAELLERQLKDVSTKAAATKRTPLIPTIKVKRKRAIAPPKQHLLEDAKKAKVGGGNDGQSKLEKDSSDDAGGGGGLGGLLGGYGSVSDSD
uniref:Splicing factor YJU2 n=1 Tax=Odontella aurita TaxID=265563 RepID=A0A7S4JRU1_9STRA|mmetsp:Transcript_52747/g.157917  ORF Transcript_52747/g.157917 Transcript_52747/m.157917 type:complete len:361 (+) Transcript_52747:198-1280(+)